MNAKNADWVSCRNPVGIFITDDIRQEIETRDRLRHCTADVQLPNKALIVDVLGTDRPSAHFR